MKWRECGTNSLLIWPLFTERGHKTRRYRARRRTQSVKGSSRSFFISSSDKQRVRSAVSTQMKTADIPRCQFSVLLQSKHGALQFKFRIWTGTREQIWYLDFGNRWYMWEKNLVIILKLVSVFPSKLIYFISEFS